MAQYYDLVAGLPVLALEGNRELPGYASELESLAGAMRPEDARGLWRLRLVHDCANLANAVLGLPFPFDRRGNWSPEKLNAEIAAPDEMPDFMIEFVRKGGEGGAEALDRAFFEWADALPDGWVRKYLVFELHVRAALAILQNRRRAKDAAPVAVPKIDEIAAAIGSSGAPDFGIATACPWIAALVQAADEGPLEAELAADRIRWDMAGELTSTRTFSEEAIYAFAVRLGLAARWEALGAEAGRARLERLVETLKVNVP